MLDETIVYGREIARIPKMATSHAGSRGNWSSYFLSSDTKKTQALVGQNIVDHTLEHRSSQKRPVTVRYRSASLGALTLHDMAYSMFGEGEVAINVERMAHVYLCEINLSGDMKVGLKTADKAFQPGEIYMINADAPHAKIWRSDGRQIMIKVHRKDMERALEKLTGLPIQEPLMFDPHPRPLTGMAATFGQMIDVLSADLDLETSYFAALPDDAAENLILGLLLQALPNNYSHLLANPSTTVRPRHVRHAAEYIHAHSPDQMTLDELVAVAGVSKRSLHSGFRKYYGVSPMSYLRNVRLDRARFSLKETASEATVTKVALECGFNHLGKFAGAYRDRFGELPSETLQGS